MDDSPPISGFLSFMPTYEDGLPVTYCYEIHLAPTVQRLVYLVLSTLSPS